MNFEPIAITGRACLLPGAHDPAALFRVAAESRCVIRDAPEGRWRVPDAHVVTSDPARATDHTWTRKGGYVEGFTPVPGLAGLDPLTQWIVHTARRALVDAGVEGAAARTGAVVGNLSLPSSGSARYAEQVWLGDHASAAGIPATDPRDAFNSGLPTHLLAQQLGLDAPAYALDAACASSLYAIELACRDLQEGRAQRMLAGAVNRADDLFLHVGFCALGAMSRTGQSRPFHAGADGLVPGDGCGFVVLERLEDARKAGRPIHGVIRGVGLANDGRAKNLLAPSARGQALSMQRALDQAGLGPDGVPYIECHATGTPVGDGVELESMAAVYGDTPRTIGSLKGNLGHLITAAGVAGLVKVLEAFRHRQLLPTPHLAGGERNPALDGSPFRTLDRPTPWEGPRRAGLSAFGFGGNDAHLIVEAADETPARVSVAVPATLEEPIVVVGLGARFGAGQSAADFERAALGADAGRADTVRIPLSQLRFPPNDLKKANAQQTMILAAALEASGGLELPAERTGVYVGYQCDPAIARWGARWRARSHAEALGEGTEWSEVAADVFAPPLEAPHVVGSLPNIPANRLSSQLDLQGPSFTTSAEELSGLRSLELAIGALRRGDVDAALVGAVDRPSAVQRAALAALGAESRSTDGAFALVLRRRSDAEAEGLPILGTITPGADAEALAPSLPRAHAAAGLAELCRALVLVARGLRPDGSAWAEPARGLSVAVSALGAQHSTFTVRAVGAPCDPFAHASTERALELPAQRAPVTLPPIRRAAPETTMQKMPPPPPLPPTTDDGPPAPPVSGAQMRAAFGLADAPRPVATQPQAAPGLQPVAAQPQPVAPQHPAPQPGTLLGAFAAHQVQLAQAHQAFIAQQSALHTQMMQALSQVPGGAPSQPMPFATPTATATATATPTPSTDFRGPTSEVRSPSTDLRPPSTDLRPPSTDLRAPSADLRATTPDPDPDDPDSDAPPPVQTPPPEPLPKPEPPKPSPEPDTPLAFRPRGPSFDREQLHTHAGGTISEIFGDLFCQQDGHAVQVRMPEPPLLLADRCTGIDAEPGALAIAGHPAKGTCWTETDIREDSWWLHDGYMPTGIMVESGQADLFLISYLGADFLNEGERGYRLLGCEMTWQGDLPKIGESLVYDIHVDGHARQGDVRLFFFHYDCHIRRPDGTTRPALQVRSGQAGFFTTEELADSAGILWKPEQQEILADARVDPPAVAAPAETYERTAIEAFADGRPWDCFPDPAFERTKTHTRTPRIQKDPMLFLDQVTIDPEGGPWGRGYLKAVTPISPDDWFFEGHFKNDPCMPGTLMFEGCLQAMAFYLSALGYTIDKDGWRFQPIQEETYNLRCRGQVTPESKELTYEIFVEEVHDGPVPKLYADLLCTVDGLGAFHARRFGLELTPDWPLTGKPQLVAEGAGDPKAAIGVWEGREFRFDPPSIMACAWGQPSTAFGPMYERFDGHRRTPRLPGPPYLFLTRVTQVDGAMGGLESGKRLEFEYEVPDDAWYFDENGARVMPFAVLLEAALQPCGWTASYVGSTLTSESDFLFRNLDGKGTILAEVFPQSGTLRTVVDIKGISRSSGMIITSFHVQCFLGEGEDQPVYDLDTVFGFFPPEAFEDQAGLPTTDEQRALLELPVDSVVDLTERPARFCEGTLRLAEPMLLMIDRLTLMDHEGGAAGLGRCRAEKDVDAGEWFFKAHFYQDPVQPGSLGIEAMLQLLQAFMIDKGLGEGFERPRFEGIATQREHVWKYRGQVVPEAEVVSTTIEITSIEKDERGVLALADASLWVDGKRIYEARDLGMRIVEEGEAERPTPTDEETLTLDAEPWLTDHRPTHTAPALPMMSMVDRLMDAAREAAPSCTGLHDLRVLRWVVVDPEARLKTEVEGDQVRLYVWREAKTAALSRFELAASATLGAPSSLDPLPELEGAAEPAQPYADDRLFHGPAFHYAKTLTVGTNGSTAVLDAGAGSVPVRSWHPGLLDAATHGIPHDGFHRWSDRIGEDVVGYPHALDVRFDGPPPTGEVRCEARFAGFDEGDERKPVTRLQLIDGERVYADMRLVELLMPKGPIGMAEPTARRRFLSERAPAPVSLSTFEGEVTTLDPKDVAISGWFPGTIEHVYGSAEPRAIAMQEHVAHRTGAHPFDVEPRGDRAVDRHTPLTAHPLAVEDGETIEVRTAGDPMLDLSPVQGYWRDHFGVGEWPVEDLYYGLIERFVAAFHVADPRALAALEGRAVLYLGNHQVGIESLIFSIVASALQRVPTLTLAKVEHQQSWLGKLIGECFSYPGIADPGVITYFDRSDPSSLPRIAKQLAAQAATGEGARSLMVHVEGTRAHSARHRLEKMSGIFCDLAVGAGVPIVPVRFSGGLPVEPVTEKLEYPVGMGRQDYWLGAPITPVELEALPYKERIARVVDAIGALGPDPAEESPLPGDPELVAAVRERTAGGASHGLSTLVEVLRRQASLSPQAEQLVAAVDGAPVPEGPAADWIRRLAAMLRGA